mmetsp:Transcript_8129/g.14976  ORF Transcript_8129/g.14976 Transcript_8129/m.14976 type:complete len:242 (-) Transcript_8129:1371-2096(-)
MQVPRLTRHTVSNNANRAGLGCRTVAMNAARPVSARARVALITSYAADESKPFVGLSASKRDRPTTSSTPSETRRFSPPLIPRTIASPTIVSATWDRPSRERTTSTRSRRSFSGRLAGARRLKLNSNVSRTVNVGRLTSSFGIYARMRCNFASGGYPSTKTSPVTRPSVVRPAMTLRRVVAPESGAPIQATHIPGRMYPEIPFRIRLPLDLKNRLLQTTEEAEVEPVPQPLPFPRNSSRLN